MPEHLRFIGTRDRQRVAPDELHAWATRFSVSPDQLREAVEAVGDRVDAVAAYLRAHDVEAH